MTGYKMDEGRASALGRIGVAAYLATIGAFVVSIFATIALVFGAADVLSVGFRGKPLMAGRTVGSAPLRHHIHLGKYALFGEEFPGVIPTSEHTGEPAGA